MSTSKFKDSVKRQKYKVGFEQKQRMKALSLRNKFLGEWASSILGLKEKKMKVYISNVMLSDYKKPNYENVINKIEKDFIKKDIKISYREIEFKVKDFQMKANVIIENKYKLNNKY